MPESSTIGSCLRRIRREQGLTQQELSARSGVGAGLIAKLEQGQRDTARVSSLMKLANALDVTLGALTGGRDHSGLGRDGGSVLAVRDALLSPSLLPGMPGMDADDSGEPTPLPQLQAAVSAGWDHYWGGEFGPLAATVPGLITEARLTHRSLGVPAASALAQAYQLAACLMVHLGKDDLAALGAERGIRAAAEGDDEWQWATVQGTYSWILLHQARLEESEQLAVQVAQQIEPSFSAPARHLAAWGNLLMTALAPAAAAGKDVDDYVSMAAAAAERLGHRVDAYQTGFGPATVQMQATHAYAMRREPDRALKAAKRVQVSDLFAGISRGRHLLDVAQAHTDARQRRAAVAVLERARNVSPTWFRHQPVARSLVQEIRQAETRPSAGVRSLAASLGLGN